MVYKINKFIMKTLVLTIITTLLTVGTIHTQSLNELQYAAYLKAGQSLWQRSIELAEKQHGPASFEATMSAYGLLNNTMANKDEATFDEYVELVVDQLSAIIKDQPQWGEPQAVLSTVYGLKMAYSPMKGIVYGGKSGSLIESAVKHQPESPLVQKLFGSYKLYTPSMFGGDAKEAVAAYTQSILIYEQQPTANNWLYLDALVGLALSHQKNQQTDLAIEVLEKALKIEPEFQWASALLNSYTSK